MANQNKTPIGALFAADPVTGVISTNPEDVGENPNGTTFTATGNQLADYHPFGQVYGTIYERVAATPEERAAIGSWVAATLKPEYAKLPAPSGSDSPNTRELRAHLFGALGYYAKDPAILAQAREITEKYLADPGSVDATLGQTAVAIAARNGGIDPLRPVAEGRGNLDESRTAGGLAPLAGRV